MDPKELARQLKKPEGELGIKVGNIMNEGNSVMYKHALDRMNIRDNSSVLELGFGNGKFIPEILSKAENVTYQGVDFSQAMVDEAEKLINNLNLGNRASVTLGNISSLPFADESFDIIVTINTVYFWENPLNDIKEIYRVLKKGGSFFLSFRPKSLMEKLEFTKTQFRYYDEPAAEELLKSTGFVNIKSEYQEEGEKEFFGEKFQWGNHCMKGEK